jgi:hypothetical protein
MLPDRILAPETVRGGCPRCGNTEVFSVAPFYRLDGDFLVRRDLGHVITCLSCRMMSHSVHVDDSTDSETKGVTDESR